MNVPEILRDAGPNGLHVTEIAKEANTDASKLGRLQLHQYFLSILHNSRTLSRPHIASTCDCPYIPGSRP